MQTLTSTRSLPLGTSSSSRKININLSRVAVRPQAVSIPLLAPSSLLLIPLNKPISHLPFPLAIYAQFFGKAFAPKRAASPPKRETAIPSPSFTIPAVLLGGAGLAHFGLGNDTLAGVFGVLGAFLTFQATRVRFVFDDKTLQVLIGEQKEKSENAFVGGENKWSYESFVNW